MNLMHPIGHMPFVPPSQHSSADSHHSNCVPLGGFSGLLSGNMSDADIVRLIRTSGGSETHSNSNSGGYRCRPIWIPNGYKLILGVYKCCHAGVLAFINLYPAYLCVVRSEVPTPNNWLSSTSSTQWLQTLFSPGTKIQTGSVEHYLSILAFVHGLTLILRFGYTQQIMYCKSFIFSKTSLFKLGSPFTRGRRLSCRRFYTTLPRTLP